jgi:hypothetical protein
MDWLETRYRTMTSVSTHLHVDCTSSSLADLPSRTGTHTTYFRAFKANNPANSKPTSNPDASKETTPTPAGQSLTGPSTYRTIHPLTPLEDLEDFLKDHEFALVTDEGRKWVLGVATRSDLEASSEGMHCGEVGLLTMLAGCRLLSSGEDVIEPGAVGTKEAEPRTSR